MTWRGAGSLPGEVGGAGKGCSCRAMEAGGEADGKTAPGSQTMVPWLCKHVILTLLSGGDICDCHLHCMCGDTGPEMARQRAYQGRTQILSILTARCASSLCETHLRAGSTHADSLASLGGIYLCPTGGGSGQKLC